MKRPPGATRRSAKPVVKPGAHLKREPVDDCPGASGHHIAFMCGRVIQSSGPLRYRIVEGMDMRDSRAQVNASISASVSCCGTPMTPCLAPFRPMILKPPVITAQPLLDWQCRRLIGAGRRSSGFQDHAAHRMHGPAHSVQKSNPSFASVTLSRIAAIDFFPSHVVSGAATRERPI